MTDINFYFRNRKRQLIDYNDVQNAYNEFGKKKDWCEGKSAESLARFWFNENADPFISMLESIFGIVKLTDGYFEATTSFDDVPRGPRNHDVLFKKVIYEKGKMTIGVEAKGNEEYANLIKEKYDYVNKKRQIGQNSNQDIRLDAIFDSLNSNENKIDINVYRELRYQLFSGLVGTITEAKNNKSNCAVFIIHQFLTHRSRAESLERNYKDLHQFLKFIGIQNLMKSGEIVKVPLKFKETKIANIKYASDGIDVYIGYLKTKLD